MQIVYIHGFNSSPSSHKVSLFERHLAQNWSEHTLIAPALSHFPEEAVAQLASIVIKHRNDRVMLVGSSLGGFYATYLAEHYELPAALINPAVRPYILLQPLLGPQTNYYSGESYQLTAKHIQQLEALEMNVIHPERYLLLVQTGDEVLDYKQSVSRYQNAEQVVIQGGDHSFLGFEKYIDWIIEFGLTHSSGVR